MDMIQKEIKAPLKLRDGTYKPNIELAALDCLTFLLRNHGTKVGDQFRDMHNLINDIFLGGFTNEVIQCLTAISRIKRGVYKRACQVKLLNSCSIILTQKVDKFPLNYEQQYTPPLDSTDVSGSSMRESIPSPGFRRESEVDESQDSGTAAFGGARETQGFPGMRSSDAVP